MKTTVSAMLRAVYLAVAAALTVLTVTLAVPGHVVAPWVSPQRRTQAIGGGISWCHELARAYRNAILRFVLAQHGPVLNVKTAAAAILIVASMTTPATAHADCGDPNQPACTGPVPTVDQVIAIVNELIDSDIPAANKTDIVTPGFTPTKP
jgi:hypothetical protein